MFSSIEEIWFGKKTVGDDYFVCFEGDMHRICEGVNFWASSSSFVKGQVSTAFKEIGKNCQCVEKINENNGICVEAFYESYGAVIRRRNRVTNLKESSKNLIHISSAAIHIPADGLLSWNDPRRFSIYLCTMGWSTENQWKKCTLEDLGILPMRKNQDGSAYRHTIRSEGSWSTGRYYPLLIVEDHEKGKTYFMEHEGAVSWEMNIGMGFFTTPETLSIECGSADTHHDGFVKKLRKGESYETTPAICGMVDGGFEEAVAALTDYKRQTSLHTWEKGYPPVCYNVFMGAVFAKINEKNLLSLIQAASDVGCEVFCIDAGWFIGEGRGNRGDYLPDDHKFGEYSLQDIIDRIKEKHMIPGLWFELEASALGTDCLKVSEHSVLKRYGAVISEERGFYDLSIPKVREHILSAIDRAYAMGVRYIKNDYNQSTGIGVGEGISDFSHNNRKAYRSLCELIDEIYEKYPDMIIENCGSGAMREDHGTLSHFHLQSTSDQEMFYNYPPIASGAAAVLPLEKAGNWAYPYALGENEYESFDRGEETEFLIERNKDGENTIFSMINGMLGVLYMSGRIDYLDERNRSLTTEAVNVYKKLRKWIPKMYPIYPTGFGTIGKREFVTLGITDQERKKIYLAVWKINAPEDTVTIDLSSYAGKNAKIRRIYPEKDDKGKFTYAAFTKQLTVQLSGSLYMARLFEIDTTGNIGENGYGTIKGDA